MGSDPESPSLGGPLFRPPRGGPAGVRAGGSAGGQISRPGDDLLAAVFAAVEAAPMPLVLSDPNRPDDPIVFANPAFLRMSGYDRAEVVGRNCRFLQGPGTDPAAVEAVSRALRDRGEVAVELLNYRKDGTPFWNALSVAPVFDAAGRLAYHAASQRDVSRRREAEDALRRAGPVEGAKRGAGRALGEVAHDINNMLQVVAGHVEALRDQASPAGDPKVIRRLRAASEAAARAAALTRELLDGPPGAAATGASPGDREEPAEPAAIVPDGIRSGARVLVVDDRAEVADLARTMLEAAGYAVEVAGGGRQALERLPGGFDLLFSDLVMPGDLDGVGLAREAQRRDPRLKVLLTTGRAGPAGAPPEAGGFETIAKPYRRSELVGAVRRLLGRPDASG